jgi:hypothetical protein
VRAGSNFAENQRKVLLSTVGVQVVAELKRTKFSWNSGTCCALERGDWHDRAFFVPVVPGCLLTIYELKFNELYTIPQYALFRSCEIRLKAVCGKHAVDCSGLDRLFSAYRVIDEIYGIYR